MKPSLRKIMAVLCIFLAFGYLASCSNSGTEPLVEDPPVTDTTEDGDQSISLGGTVGGSDVKLSLSLNDEAGAARTSSTEQALEGFLVYDDMTLNCTGTYDTATGEFIVSASGTISQIKLVFSLLGLIVNGEVTEAAIMLTVYNNGEIEGSYSADLVAVDEEVAKTSSVCTDASAEYAFEGRWYIDDGGGAYQSLTFTDSSFSYLSNDGDGDIFTLNGTLLAAEAGSNNTDWNIIFLIDENMADSESGLDVFGLEIYEVFYLKGVVAADGSTISFADPFDIEQNTLYYLSNYDLEQIFSVSPITQTAVNNAKYAGYQIDKVVNPETSPSFYEGISITSLLNAAEALDYNSLETEEFHRK